MLIPHMAETQVAAVHVPGAHHRGVPAFQRGYQSRQVSSLLSPEEVQAVSTLRSHHVDGSATGSQWGNPPFHGMMGAHLAS